MRRLQQNCQKPVQWQQSDGCQFKQNGLTFDSEMAEKDAIEIFAAYSQNGGFECQLT